MTFFVSGDYLNEYGNAKANSVDSDQTVLVDVFCFGSLLELLIGGALRIILG